MGNMLRPNDDIVKIGAIRSQDGRSILIMQTDGNLVLYRFLTGGRHIARWSTGTNDQIVTQAVMQGDGNFVVYGPHGALWNSGTHGNPGAWLVLQNDGNLVIYDASGAPLWATYSLMKMVPGFNPSTSAFHFANRFPQVPDITINILGNEIGIGDASRGLCGGMTFAARDYFETGISIPSDKTPPSSGPLFDYLVHRLIESFNLALPFPPPPPPFITPAPPFGPGPLTYLHLMNPALPDHETMVSKLLLAYRGRAWVMINEQWPKIKEDIDNGLPSPLALILLKSTDPSLLGNNHQVLAYGYELDDSNLIIWLYDPNMPKDDYVTLSLDISNPENTTSIISNYSIPDREILCFFRPYYYRLLSPP